VGFILEETTMQHHPLFVFTKKGYINLSLVRHIKPAERGVVRFVFSDSEYIDLPEAEARQVEHIMEGELFIYPG
jgi:hypothetical protein